MKIIFFKFRIKEINQTIKNNLTIHQEAAIEINSKIYYNLYNKNIKVKKLNRLKNIAV